MLTHYVAWINPSMASIMENAGTQHDPAKLIEARAKATQIETLFEEWAQKVSPQKGVCVFNALDGYVLVPTTHIAEIKEIMRQVRDATETQLCVGIGATANEARTAAREAAPGQVLRSDQVQLNKAEGDSPNRYQSFKGTGKYNLFASRGSGQHQGAGAGYKGFSQGRVDSARPNDDTAGDTNPLAAMVSMIRQKKNDGELPPVEASRTIRDLLEDMHKIGASQAEATHLKKLSSKKAKEVDAAIEESLSYLYEKAPQMEQIKQQDPKLHDSIIQLANSVVELIGHMKSGKLEKSDNQLLLRSLDLQ